MMKNALHTSARTTFACATLLLALLAPSLQAGTHVWSGAVNGYWNVAGNWSSGGAPAAGEADVIVHFPTGATRQVTTNNIANLAADSIRITGNGYRLHGNAVTLTPTAAEGTNVIMAPGGIGGYIHLPLVLSARSYSVYVDAFATLEISGAISGTGGLSKRGEGLLRIAGDQANSFSGGFSQLQGDVALNKTLGVALPGPVFVGVLNSGADVVMTYEWHHQIADAAVVHVWGRNGLVTLDGYNDTVHSLHLVDSEVRTWSLGNPGVLSLNGDVTAAQMDNTGNWTPIISGRLNLGNSQHTFNIESNAVMSVSARVESTGTNGGITVVGGGALNFSGSNSFAGPLRVQAGGVYSYDSHGLGSAAGPTILEGGNLSMGHGQTNTEPVHVLAQATLSARGTNAWYGPITVATNALLIVDGNHSGDRLTIHGSIRGEGNTYYSIERVELAGTSGNTLSGTNRIVGATRMFLNKTTGNALSGTIFLHYDNQTFPSVQWLRPDQIENTARIISNDEFSFFQDAGMLDLNGFTDTVGSIKCGQKMPIQCGTGKLTVGGDNLDSVCRGSVVGTGSGTNLAKIGAGTLVLGGSNVLSGKILVEAGKLILSNATGVGAVHLNPGAQLAGNSQLGALTAAASSFVLPGVRIVNTSYGTLRPASVSFGGSYLHMGLAGTNAGVDCDQIVTSGPLNLTGVNLTLSALNLPHGSNSFTLIDVTGGASVTGTFVGLPEGTVFPSSDGKSFRITYQGGTGNDVVVARHYAMSPGGAMTGVTPLPDGRIRIGGTGLPFESYRVLANTNLSTTNWINIGSVSSGDEFGTLEFIDNDAPNFPMRFYRFVLP